MTSTRFARSRARFVTCLTALTAAFDNRGAAAALAIGLLAQGGPAEVWAAKKKRLTPQAALSAALDGRRDDIQGCALRLSGTATAIQVVTHLTLNNQGALINSRITVTAPGADADGIKACVEGVLRTIKFPRSDAPLVTIDRTWDMKLQ